MTHNGLWPSARDTTRVRPSSVPSSLGRVNMECRPALSVSSDFTGGDRNMRYAFVIAMLLGSTLLAQAEPIDRDKWIAWKSEQVLPC
jgi:hypothetical protein